MTEVAYFENLKTKKRYKVLDLDPETKIVRLQGPNSVFEEKYDKSRFIQMGYKLVRVEEAEPEAAE